MSKRMDCLIVLNMSYYKAFFVLINNMFQIHPDVEIHWWLLHDELSDENVQELEDYIIEKKAFLHSIRMDTSKLDDFQVIHRWCKEIYYRLLAPYVLPDDIERVLIIDIDSCINGDIYEYYSRDFQGKACMVVEAATEIDAVNDWQREGFRKSISDFNTMCNRNPKEKYFCVGFVVMNLPVLRSLVSLEKTISIMSQFPFVFPEQDFYNYVLSDNMKIWADDKYLYQFMPYHNGVGKSVAWVKENVKVIHYCGYDKPWETLDTPMPEIYGLWWKYAEGTPFYNEMLLSLPQKIDWINSQLICRDKYKTYYNTLCKFLDLVTYGISIGSKFEKFKMKKVIIYGYGRIGKYLVRELMDSEVEIVGIIDKQVVNELPKSIPYISSDKNVQSIIYDGVVVTPMNLFNEIRFSLESKGFSKIISIDEILNS